VVGFLLLVSLVITTALTAVGKYMGGLMPGTAALLHVGNFVVSFLVVAVLFALIFKYLPDARIGWRDVWFGALVTAALFTLGKYLIGLYLTIAAPGSAFGAAGSVVAFVVWVYYSGLIVLFGAELTQVTADHAGRRIEPTKDAVLKQREFLDSNGILTQEGPLRQAASRAAERDHQIEAGEMARVRFQAGELSVAHHAKHEKRG